MKITRKFEKGKIYWLDGEVLQELVDAINSNRPVAAANIGLTFQEKGAKTGTMLTGVLGEWREFTDCDGNRFKVLTQFFNKAEEEEV